jgi:hypothetical protein
MRIAQSKGTPGSASLPENKNRQLPKRHTSLKN